MTDLRAAAQQALEALETVFMPHHPAVISLRAALEQPEQAEPSASWPSGIDIADEIDALLPTSMGYSTRAAIEAWWRDLVQRRLEQTEQAEPVAWMYKGIKSDGTEHGPHLVWVPAYMDAMSAEKGAVASPLYTHPPRRETESAFDALVAISLLTHLGGEVAEYADVVEAVRRLHALNGELLEALKQMLEVWEEDPAYGAKHADKARAAVIRARGNP
jgi:hypothetical protein